MTVMLIVEAAQNNCQDNRFIKLVFVIFCAILITFISTIFMRQGYNNEPTTIAQVSDAGVAV